MPRRNRRVRRRRMPNTAPPVVRDLSPEQAARRLVVAGRCSVLILDDRRRFTTPKGDPPA